MGLSERFFFTPQRHDEDDLKINRDSFFKCFRTYHKSARGKSLVQSQVDGLSFLLDVIEMDAAWKTLPQASYFLATIAHETAWTFEPIKEYRGKVLSAAQKRYWPSGYYGRGYIQLTWARNYDLAGKKLGVDLLGNPDLALKPEVAYDIASHGMREGWFTGKKLSNYINSKTTDYLNARRIVNGVDKAAHIAGIAESLESCLKSSVADDGGEKTVVSTTGADSSEGQSVPDTQAGPSVNVEHAGTVQAATPPLEGGKKDDAPIQASQGGTKSLWATIGGGAAGIFTAVKGWVDGNNMLAVVGVICLTLLLLSLMFRQVLLDWLRMKLISDPSKLNVK